MIKEFGLKSAIKYETKMRQGVRKKVRLKINEMYIKFCITYGVQTFSSNLSIMLNRDATLQTHSITSHQISLTHLQKPSIKQKSY